MYSQVRFAIVIRHEDFLKINNFPSVKISSQIFIFMNITFDYTYYQNRSDWYLYNLNLIGRYSTVKEYFRRMVIYFNFLTPPFKYLFAWCLAQTKGKKIDTFGMCFILANQKMLHCVYKMLGIVSYVNMYDQ